MNPRHSRTVDILSLLNGFGSIFQRFQLKRRENSRLWRRGWRRSWIMCRLPRLPSPGKSAQYSVAFQNKSLSLSPCLGWLTSASPAVETTMFTSPSSLCGIPVTARRGLTSFRSSALSSSPTAAGFLALTLETLGATLATGGLGEAGKRRQTGSLVEESGDLAGLEPND